MLSIAINFFCSKDGSFISFGLGGYTFKLRNKKAPPGME